MAYAVFPHAAQLTVVYREYLPQVDKIVVHVNVYAWFRDTARPDVWILVRTRDGVRQADSAFDSQEELTTYVMRRAQQMGIRI